MYLLYNTAKVLTDSIEQPSFFQKFGPKFCCLVASIMFMWKPKKIQNVNKTCAVAKLSTHKMAFGRMWHWWTHKVLAAPVFSIRGLLFLSLRKYLFLAMHTSLHFPLQFIA